VEINLLLGNSIEILKDIPDNSIDSCVCDPPYGISFMRLKWDYDVPSVELWKEVLRVLKPGAHLLAFAGTRTQHRMAVNIEDAGFEIRDMIGWICGSGFPKSTNMTGELQGWGSALKPALEPITMARKPFPGSIKANAEKWGTGIINIDGSRVGTEILPEAKAGQARIGTFERSNMITPERIGRYPANLIHDGSEEVLELFPDTKPSKANPRNNSEFKSFSKGKEKAHITQGHEDDGGSAARFFYCAKASVSEKEEGLDSLEDSVLNRVNPGGIENDPKWAPRIRKNSHPTVKPVKLMSYLCKLVTPVGGTVLDPFMGSGTTGIAAVKGGFGFMGIELDSHFFEIAKKRIEHHGKKE
jgi:site-specific DNA-methyltransferase (adenine-specific)